MTHPTDNVNGGVEEPTVPTPRPDKANEPTDPTRTTKFQDEEAKKIQDEIRRRQDEEVE